MTSGATVIPRFVLWIAIVPSAALAFSACGDSPAYEPGSLPSSLTFSVVRVVDSGVEGMSAQREIAEAFDVGSPTADYFDGSIAVWRFRTIFGDLIDEPGARIEFRHAGYNFHYEDPARTFHDTEYCLVVTADGRAMAEYANVKEPVSDQPGLVAAEVRLRLDESSRAAHRQLGVLRIQLLHGATVVDTLTEDDFAVSWHLHDERGKKRRVWSLREIVKARASRVASVQGRDGTATSITADSWADAQRMPVLAWDALGMDFYWTDAKAAEPRAPEVRDVTALQLVRTE